MQDNMVGQNIIITEKLSVLRQLGRNALRGKWKTAILAVIITILCTSVPRFILDRFFGVNPAVFMQHYAESSNLDPETYADMYNTMSTVSPLSTIYIILVTGAFTLELSLFFLASFRGHNVKAKDVFLGFERFGKALGLLLYTFLLVFLWSLLFIIPGIVASFRYSQAFFILADDPQKSIGQCIRESKMMMKGNKGTFFLLNLSFIGWMLLTAVPMGLIQYICSSMITSPAALTVINILVSLIYAPVYAYLLSTQAGFYEILSGHLIKETAPAPVTADQIDVEAPIAHIEEVIESVEEKEQAEAEGILGNKGEDTSEDKPEE